MVRQISAKRDFQGVANLPAGRFDLPDNAKRRVGNQDIIRQKGRMDI